MPVNLVSYDLAELTGASFGFSMQTTMSSANRDGLVSFFAICKPFSKFSCLAAVADLQCCGIRTVKADVLALFLS